ncbi:MAG: hypothetical protein IPG73_13725 [Ignavibacteria bacterium]|nr:hypothetical protein [Ignavibacteria bacterium]
MPDDHVVLAGLTSSISEIATKEAHQEQNGASFDAFVAVFRSDSTTLVEAEEREKNTQYRVDQPQSGISSYHCYDEQHIKRRA